MAKKYDDYITENGYINNLEELNKIVKNKANFEEIKEIEKLDIGKQTSKSSISIVTEAGKIKKYSELTKEKCIVEQLFEENAELNEGFLLDLKRYGFFKGFKMLGLRGLNSVATIVKEDPALQQKLKDTAAKFGNGVLDDIGVLMGDLAKKIETADAKNRDNDKYRKDVEDRIGI